MMRDTEVGELMSAVLLLSCGGDGTDTSELIQPFFIQNMPIVQSTGPSNQLLLRLLMLCSLGVDGAAQAPA